MSTFCPKCGAPAGKADNFCSNCGRSLNSAEADRAATSPARYETCHSTQLPTGRGRLYGKGRSRPEYYLVARITGGPRGGYITVQSDPYKYSDSGKYDAYSGAPEAAMTALVASLVRDGWEPIVGDRYLFRRQC
jgi:hypothetical protein